MHNVPGMLIERYIINVVVLHGYSVSFKEPSDFDILYDAFAVPYGGGALVLSQLFLSLVGLMFCTLFDFIRECLRVKGMVNKLCSLT